MFVQQAFTLLFVPHAFWAKYYAAMGPPPGTLQPRPGFIDQTRLSVWPRVGLTLFTHEANQSTPTGWVCPPSATCCRRWSGHADADAPARYRPGVPLPVNVTGSNPTLLMHSCVSAS